MIRQKNCLLCKTLWNGIHFRFRIQNLHKHDQTGTFFIFWIHANLVPRAFPLKNGWGGKRPWHRLVTCPLVHPKILGVIN